jgi:hypothetical protein
LDALKKLFTFNCPWKTTAGCLLLNNCKCKNN